MPMLLNECDELGITKYILKEAIKSTVIKAIITKIYY